MLIFDSVLPGTSKKKKWLESVVSAEDRNLTPTAALKH